MVETSAEEGRDRSVEAGTASSLPPVDVKKGILGGDRQDGGLLVPGQAPVNAGAVQMNGNGRQIKDLHDRICDMVLFSMAGGLVYGLAILKPPVLEANEIAILVGGLVGAVTMYLKGK